MNADIIRQILEESKEIPDEVLRFHVWESSENGVTVMCPVGRHLLNHPEIYEQVGAESRTTTYDGIKKSCRKISTWKLSKYLDIELHEAYFLFNDPDLIREIFEDNIEKFLSGAMIIRECGGEDCDDVFATYPNDRCVVCRDCKEYMLGMCGI